MLRASKKKTSVAQSSLVLSSSVWLHGESMGLDLILLYMNDFQNCKDTFGNAEDPGSKSRLNTFRINNKDGPLMILLGCNY